MDMIRLVIGKDKKEPPLLAKTCCFLSPLTDQVAIPLNLQGVCFGDYEVSLTFNDEIIIDEDIWHDHFSYEEVPSITQNFEYDHPSSKDHLIEVELNVILDYEWPCGAPSSDAYHPRADGICPHSGNDALECAFPRLKTLTIKEVGRKINRRDNFPETNFVIMDFPSAMSKDINRGKPITTLFHDKIVHRVHWVTYNPIKDSDQYEACCHLADVHIKSEKTGERTSEEDLKWLHDLSRTITMKEQRIDTDVWPGGNYAFWLHDDNCCKKDGSRCLRYDGKMSILPKVHHFLHVYYGWPDPTRFLEFG